jgi:hypothetical protein
VESAVAFRSPLDMRYGLLDANQEVQNGCTKPPPRGSDTPARGAPPRKPT